MFLELCSITRYSLWPSHEKIITFGYVYLGINLHFDITFNKTRGEVDFCVW